MTAHLNFDALHEEVVGIIFSDFPAPAIDEKALKGYHGAWCERAFLTHVTANGLGLGERILHEPDREPSWS